MATKSRLGKGLGALFPSLPGESAKSEAATEPAVAVAGAKADNKIAGKVSENVAGGATVAGQSAGKTAVKSSVATAKASVDAVHDMKKNVSRETKKGSGHRASMPSITLNETAHPADMFFGSTSPVATSEVKQESVSRETAAVKKTEDKKNDEPELLPVQGGYLVELRLSDVGPNLHQPRTIFDEDDLRELADSIKEVGVLQPIVVRKRPLAQIEAARKENAAKDAESHNMFDGRMDSMYELIMGERRWRASQIAGLKTIPVESIGRGGRLSADDRRFWLDAGAIVKVGVEVASANRQYSATAESACDRTKEGCFRLAVGRSCARIAWIADGS